MTETDGWIEWDGGDPKYFAVVSPVPIDTWIAVKFRGKPDPAKGTMRTHGFAGQLLWWHDGTEDDIIAYKLEPKP